MKKKISSFRQIKSIRVNDIIIHKTSAEEEKFAIKLLNDEHVMVIQSDDAISLLKIFPTSDLIKEDWWMEA